MDEPIQQFWAWWGASKDLIAEAIANGTSTEWADEVSEQVARVHPQLDWEMGKGRVSRHALCLSGMGDPELRLLAERWFDHAPEADETWEYHPTRIAVADPTCVVLDFGDTRVPFRDLRVGIEEDEARECLHVEVWHPAFHALPEVSRRQVAYLMLDNTLGEDGVERWLGVIHLVDRMPPDAVDLPGLRERVQHLASQATGEVYARLTGETEGGEPIDVVANLALKRWDHPTFHAHGMIEVPFSPDEHGMPSFEESVQLDRLEVGLVRSLGDTAVFAGREQGLGRRVVHLYAAEDGPVPAAVQRWAAHAPRKVTVRWERDPGWQAWRRW